MSEEKQNNLITTVELGGGYQDKESPELIHKKVVFSKRPSGADFMNAIEATEGANPEYLLELMTASISEFGELPLPVPMTVLLSLNWLDQEQLQSAFYEFLGNTSADESAFACQELKDALAKGAIDSPVYSLIAALPYFADQRLAVAALQKPKGEKLSTIKETQNYLEKSFNVIDKVRLLFGVERDGVKYDVVEFGNILNGYDQIQIRKDSASAMERDILTIGREIARLSSSDGARKLDGGLSLDDLKNLDYEAFINLKKAVEDWRNSFRKRRAKLD